MTASPPPEDSMHPQGALDLAFRQHLQTEHAPLTVHRDGQPPRWDDAGRHRAAFASDPALYALCALGPRVTWEQRARILYLLLESPRRNLPDAVRALFERVTVLLMLGLSADAVLTVFLALRRTRANHRHVSHAIVSYLFQHPHACDLARRRRKIVLDCLEHALGRNTARACLAALAEQTGESAPGGPRQLKRIGPILIGGEAAALAAILCRRPPLSSSDSAKRSVTDSARSEADFERAHIPYAQVLGRELPRPGRVTAANRGEIAALLVDLYRSGTSPQRIGALQKAVATAVTNLPRFEGSLALILDASASMRGLGEREFCALAQAVALERILQGVCRDCRVYVAGGFGWPPAPEGATDLARPLLDALEGQPDLAVIVSDGYENIRQGDVARIAASLPRIGVTTRIVFCHSKFGPTDDLTDRRPAPDIAEMAFWHQDDFEDLLLGFSLASGTEGMQGFRAHLLRKLAWAEREFFG